MWKVALGNTGASLFPCPLRNNLGLEPTVIRRIEMEINATSIHRSVILSSSRQILLWLKKHLELGDFHFLHMVGCYWGRCLHHAGNFKCLYVLNGLRNTLGCICTHPPIYFIFISLHTSIFSVKCLTDNSPLGLVWIGNLDWLPLFLLLFSYLFLLSSSGSDSKKAPLWISAPFGLFVMVMCELLIGIFRI